MHAPLTQHAAHQVRLCEGGADGAAPLDLAAVRARCPEHVSGERFYAATGNDYRGEFRSLRDGWGGGGGGETLGRIEFAAAEALRPHLRSCAWLDVASHPMVWWMAHRGRGFYAAAVREYRVLRHRVTDNRQLWSVRTAAAADGGARAAAAEDGAISTLQIYDAASAPVVRVDGSRAGRFACTACAPRVRCVCTVCALDVHCARVQRAHRMTLSTRCTCPGHARYTHHCVQASSSAAGSRAGARSGTCTTRGGRRLRSPTAAAARRCCCWAPCQPTVRPRRCRLA